MLSSALVPWQLQRDVTVPRVPVCTAYGICPSTNTGDHSEKIGTFHRFTVICCQVL
jgi:hypothetical protein